MARSDRGGFLAEYSFYKLISLPIALSFCGGESRSMLANGNAAKIEIWLLSILNVSENASEISVSVP